MDCEHIKLKGIERISPERPVLLMWQQKERDNYTQFAQLVPITLVPKVRTDFSSLQFMISSYN